MSVDALIARMTEEAQSRIAGLRADADAEIAELKRQRAQAASIDQSQLLAARRGERQATFAVERAHELRQAAVRILTAQHAFVERVFVCAQALAAAVEARYGDDVLGRDVEAVAGHLGGQAALLRCRPALADVLRRCTTGLGNAEIVTDDTMPLGFVATTRDGYCTIDCTLPARLEALRPRLQAALLARVSP